MGKTLTKHRLVIGEANRDGIVTVRCGGCDNRLLGRAEYDAPKEIDSIFKLHERQPEVNHLVEEAAAAEPCQIDPTERIRQHMARITIPDDETASGSKPRRRRRVAVALDTEKVWAIWDAVAWAGDIGDGRTLAALPRKQHRNDKTQAYKQLAAALCILILQADRPSLSELVGIPVSTLDYWFGSFNQLLERWPTFPELATKIADEHGVSLPPR